jgi:hypothetical protein
MSPPKELVSRHTADSLKIAVKSAAYTVAFSQLICLIDECHSVFRGPALCHREPDRATRLGRSLSKNVDEIFWL